MVDRGKMKINKFIFVLLSCAIFMNHAMEEGSSRYSGNIKIKDSDGKIFLMDRSEASKKFKHEKIRIEDNKGRIFSVPRNAAIQCEYIKRVLEVENENSSYDISFLGMSHKEDIVLTKDVILRILECVDNETMIPFMLKKELVNVMATADYLEAPNNMLKNIAIKMLENNIENETVARQITTFADITINESCYNNFGLCYKANLDLRNRKLYSLRGVDTFNESYQIKEHYQINALDVSYNELRILDVDALRRRFPSLKKIDARNNKIKHLIITKKLPDGFELILDNNDIEHVTSFKIGQKGTISVKNNPKIKGSAYQRLLNATKPSFIDKYKHLFLKSKKIRKNLPWDGILIGLPCLAFLGSCASLAPYTIMGLLSNGIKGCLPSKSSFFIAGGYSYLGLYALLYLDKAREYSFNPSKIVTQ